MAQFVDPANLLTLASLISAVACSFLAIQRHIHWAVVALILSGLCDLFDGVVARRMQRGEDCRRFGSNLDSLVDACAFGFAPVVLLFNSGCRSLAEGGLLGLFAVCVVWRLAYFNTVPMSEVDGRRYFTGMPSTYVALFFPLVYLVGLVQERWLRPGLVAMTVTLMLAMVSTRKVRKPGGLAYVFFLGLAVVAVVLLLWKGDRSFEPPSGV
jgi:CDP-diacylglycerol--serine O-phosphatidyltransferase